jgi:uncharacterized membrane protein YidH (DUF202 family)
MSNIKDKISSIVAYISFGIGILQAAVMGYNTWLATATSNPSVTDYINLVILIAIGVIGKLTGKNSDGTTKSDVQLAKQADPVLPVVKVVAVILLLGCASMAQAQGFQNFWHPRPPATLQEGTFMSRTVVAPLSVFEFKPAITVAAFGLSAPDVSGAPWVTGMVAGAGPGLSFANTMQDANGVNYVNYSITASVLFGSTFNNIPAVGTSGALMFGALNNLVSLGAKYDFYAPEGRKPWMILVGVQFMPTLN